MLGHLWTCGTFLVEDDKSIFSRVVTCIKFCARLPSSTRAGRHTILTVERLKVPCKTNILITEDTYNAVTDKSIIFEYVGPKLGFFN